MTFTLAYHELVKKEDLPRIPKNVQETIKRAIESRLTTHPDLYGHPLRRSLHGYLKLRVGDYRIIFKVTAGTVKILIIGHRSWAYEKINLRL